MEWENEGGSLYFSPKFLVDRGMKVDLCILVQNFTRFHVLVFFLSGMGE